MGNSYLVEKSFDKEVYFYNIIYIEYNITKEYVNKIVLLTGVSWSGKTTLQEELIHRGWASPQHFTTRKPRGDEELDDYVFLTREQFLTKLGNWDFLEHMEFNWAWYSISKFLPKMKNVVIIVDPEGRQQLTKKFKREWVEYKSYYLDIDKQTQTERLAKRGDEEETKKERSNDFDLFFPSPKCKILDWSLDATHLADIIENK